MKDNIFVKIIGVIFAITFIVLGTIAFIKGLIS